MRDASKPPTLQDVFATIIDETIAYKAEAPDMADTVTDSFLLMKCLEAFGEAAGRQQHAALSDALFTHTKFDIQAMRECVDTLPFLLYPANA